MIEIFSIINEFEFLQIGIIIFLGLFVGSFLNVVNYRLPIMEDYNIAKMIDSNAEKSGDVVSNIIKKYKGFNLAFPNSSCPKCSHNIRFYENIPLISYLFLKGKCISCKNKISLEYPLVELANALLWIACYLYMGFCFELLFVLPFITLLLSAAMIDIRHKIVFDSYHLLIFSLGAMYSVLGYSNISLEESITTSIFSFFGLYIFIYTYEKIRGMEDHMFGRGDIKLIGALGAWLGYIDLLTVMTLSTIIGIMYYIIIYISNVKRKNIGDLRTPFVPFLSISTLVIFIASNYYNFKII